nr:MBL fold metallo-hydrolase [Armatimonadota bacterium]
WANADAMGVDPAQAQALVLSHGHYDHTRGLPGLLQRLGELRVIAHPLVFEPRYHETPDGEMADIGPPMSREELEELGARFELSDEPVQVLEGAVTTGEVPRRSGLAPEAPHLMVERDGQVRPDDFRDDLSVVVETGGAPVLVTGCAHAGLVDIAERAEEVAGRYPSAIIGGTHLADESEERIAAVAAGLHQRGVRWLAPMHCSGERGAELLEKHFEAEVLRPITGDTIGAYDDGSISIV